MNKKTLGLLSVPAAVLIGAGALTYVAGQRTVGPNEVGVRTNLIFDRGIEDRVYEPGTHFVMPFINDFNTYSTQIRTIDMTADPEEGDREGDDSLRFKTRDGNDISLDLGFTYSIDPTLAPHILGNVGPNLDALEERIIRPYIRSIPRDTFGNLTTAQFYSAEQRNAAAQSAEDALREALAPHGILVGEVLPGDYQFMNSDYTELIGQKTTAQAQVDEYEARILAQTQENIANVRAAEGREQVTQTAANDYHATTIIDADAFYTEQQNAARAILAEGRNQASVIERQRQAMASQGGINFVQMQIAESLEGIPIYMVPSTGGSGTGGSGIQLQTFDVNNFLELTGLESIANDRE